MTDILQTIVAHKRLELAQAKRHLPLEALERELEALDPAPVPSMRQALLASPTGIIAEFKRRSPSRGWIHRQARPAQVTAAYQQAGAAALSVLTDGHFFGGSPAFVREARQGGVTLPILYKNFVIDRYQLLQARLCGASAVLLIAACLTLDQCAALLSQAHGLGLEVLLEIHRAVELPYAQLQPDMVGVNNRDLGTFVTRVQNSFDLAAQLPAGTVRVSESGIGDPAMVRRLRQAGYSGFLMGEHFMRQASPGEALRQFIAEL